MFDNHTSVTISIRLRISSRLDANMRNYWSHLQEEKLQEKALGVATLMESSLNSLKDKHDIIGDVRGVGMFWGVDLVQDRESRLPATEQAAYVVRRLVVS